MWRKGSKSSVYLCAENLISKTCCALNVGAYDYTWVVDMLEMLLSTPTALPRCKHPPSCIHALTL
jgi:hypothetical protein